MQSCLLGIYLLARVRWFLSNHLAVAVPVRQLSTEPPMGPLGALIVVESNYRTMARKTFDVADLLTTTNNILAAGVVNANGELVDMYSVEYKKGAIDLLCNVLHATGQYAGFGYLDTYDAADPEFAVEDGRKNFRRKYFLASRDGMVKARKA